MNSALKPVLAGPQPGGQASPAKGNVANHAVGLPQGAQNSLLLAGAGALVGQNLSAAAAPPAPALPPLAAPPHAAPPHPAHTPHPAPSMAPVSANMAQMAQNMSHHGNLSHVTQNSVAPTNMAASPNKSASTSSPLSLVADKPQPLALTRTPEKKEADTPGPANGTVESPKPASGAPAGLKPLNPEPNKEKQDIAKTSPSTPKPPEKPTSVPTTPQKPEPAIPVSTTDGPSQPKVATANEAPEKSPSKPIEPKAAPTADVAPTQSDSKPAPESANDSQLQNKAPPPKPEAEAAKPEVAAKPEEKKEEPKVDKPPPNGTEEKVEKEEPQPPVDKKEEAVKAETKKAEPVEKEKEQKPKEEKPEEKKPEPKAAKEPKATPKSTMKLATVTPPMRKRRQASPKQADGATPAKKPAIEADGTPDSRNRRNRTQVQLYQSPTPELTMATKLSASAGRSTPTKPNDDKLIVFYKNEYLAVRNAEGSFYVCQTTQNVYRTTRKIKIRWLSQDKSDSTGETYKPDFYDVTDMECVLTTLSLIRAAGGGGAQVLKPAEEARARSILQRALRAEASGGNKLEISEEHPDGLDLSLYKDESQLEKKGRKRTSSKSSPRAKQESASETAKEAATPAKKARTTPKRSPKSGTKAKQTPPKLSNKRKPPGSTPIVASTSKTATAVSEKAKGKATPKRASKLAKLDTPPAPLTRTGRRSAAKAASPPAPVPSTSTGKSARAPRRPPHHK